ARLRTLLTVVPFRRNWSQIPVDGRPVLLDGPVRVKAGVWLVPESFVSTVLPRIATAPPAALPRAAATVTLDEWRPRSDPPLPRGVLPTSPPVPHRNRESRPHEA